jgi:hypothetical protein
LRSEAAIGARRITRPRSASHLADGHREPSKARGETASPAPSRTARLYPHGPAAIALLAGGWLGPPFVWHAERRSQLRAELDASFFHAYGLSRDETRYVLESFWGVRRNDEQAFGEFRSRNLILAAYDAMAAASPARPFVSSLDPPPGDSRAAHPPRPGDVMGQWNSWREVTARAPAPTAGRLVTAKATPGSGPRKKAGRPAPRPSTHSTSAASTAPLTLDFTPAAGAGEGRWAPETSLDPFALIPGARIRHRSFGIGTLLSIESNGRSSQLLIRFEGWGEKWIAFGYGLLEFGESRSSASPP